MKSSRFIMLGLLLLGGSMLALGCGAGAAIAKNSSIVQVEYTGKLKDGTVFDTSVGRQPLEFTVGAGQMIAGFDKAVLGMKVGESKTVTIVAADAYGTSHAELITIVNRTDLPAGLTPTVGQRLQETRQDGSIATVTITAVSADNVTIDANHPLAGKDLIFEIKLLSVK